MKPYVHTTGQGESILMIHGIISDASFFVNIAEDLASDYKVITYDRIGYGSNVCDRETTDYSVAAQAREAIQIIEEYSDGPAWIVGNSAGGLIAIEICFQRPELVKGLILVEPSLTFDQKSKDVIIAWNKELNDIVETKKIKKAMKAFVEKIGQPESNDKSLSLAELKQTYANLENFMYGELNEIQHYEQIQEECSRLNRPICVYITEDGCNSIFAETSRSGAEIMNWNITTIPGYHNALKDKHKEVSEIIKNTINEMKNA